MVVASRLPCIGTPRLTLRVSKKASYLVMCAVA